jgi:hypothetical protein
MELWGEVENQVFSIPHPGSTGLGGEIYPLLFPTRNHRIIFPAEMLGKLG